MIIKTVYRKRTGFVFWHFCENCENWPTFDFEEVKDPEHPPKGGFCRLCIQLRRKKSCRGWIALWANSCHLAFHRRSIFAQMRLQLVQLLQMSRIPGSL